MRTDLSERTYKLALEISKECLEIIKNGEYTLSKQLMKSATSIGANTEEALGGYSRREFRSKLSIAYKEVRETKYWLRLMKDCKLITDKKYGQYYDQTDEVGAILFSILRKTKPD